MSNGTDLATMPSTQSMLQRAEFISQSTAVEQARAVAQVQSMVIVAQQMPRDLERARAEMRMICGRMAMAQRAFYAVPNRGNGPSVHLARELARIWGNIESGVHELRRDDVAGESEIQAFAWDLQTNSRNSRTFIVPHERMKGRERVKLVDLGDIYLSNQNVGARAVRECIFAVLPTDFREEAQDICRRTLEHGEGKPIEERIEAMIATFAGIDVSVEQLEAKIGRRRGQWSPGDVAQMSVVYTSIKRDGLDKEEEFPSVKRVTADDLPGAPGPTALGPTASPAPDAQPAEPPAAEQPTAPAEPAAAPRGTSAPAQREPAKPAGRPKQTSAESLGQYGDVVDKPAPEPAGRQGTMSLADTIALGAARHGVESDDDRARMCSQILGEDVVSEKHLDARKGGLVLKHLASLDADAPFVFTDGSQAGEVLGSVGSADAKAAVDGSVSTAGPPPSPPVQAAVSPNDWDAAKWRKEIAAAGLKVSGSQFMPEAKRLGLGLSPPVQIATLDEIAGTGVGADLYGWLQDNAVGDGGRS